MLDEAILPKKAVKMLKSLQPRVQKEGWHRVSGAATGHVARRAVIGRAARPTKCYARIGREMAFFG